MRKPPWMTPENWGIFLKLNPRVECKDCGESDPDRMTIDHVVARALGGTDDPDNLQWLCGPCNSRKWLNDDLYWSQRFYFDHPVNLVQAREAHRRLFELILHHRDWFKQPFSRINRVLLTNAWVVGAGKTIAIPLTASALNHVILRDCGAAYPRVNRILILTKETAIRDQIVRDLTEDLVRFGFLASPPRVKAVTGSWQLEPQIIEQADIWVSCIQMFFDKNNQPLPGIEGKLAGFRLIAFDELHFAFDQVLSVVHRAYNSLCFGYTGTPIKADGKQLRSVVLFSLYDYQSAHANDRSMKFLPSPDSREWKAVFEEVDIIEADMLRRGKAEKTQTASTEGYAQNIRPAITVAEAVVRHVHDCDQQFSSDRIYPIAPHRTSESDPIADLIYPVHAMIQAENIPAAKVIARHLDKMFDADRRSYPSEKGYHAEVVMSSYSDEDGKKQSGKRLDPDHPWMHFKKNQILSAKCARFLVLVDMGREGVNNPYCATIGLAASVSSVVSHVQRTLGRQLRSVIDTFMNRLHLPPDVLDTVKIISHSTYGNRPAIEEAVRYTLNMTDHLSDIPTMASLVDSEFQAIDPPSVDPGTSLSRSERIAIATTLGSQKLSGKPVSLPEVVEAFGGQTEGKKARVKEWGEKVLSDPTSARKELRLGPDLKHIPLVLREYPDVTPSDEELIRFIKHDSPRLAAYVTPMTDERRDFLREFYRKHVERFHLRDLPITTKLSQIRRSLATVILQDLKNRGGYVGPDNSIFAFTGSAIQTVLGLLPGEKADDDGKYDTPESHVILTRPDVQAGIMGWVEYLAASKGLAPYLAAGFAIPAEGIADVA
jgi:hypothetical protein